MVQEPLTVPTANEAEPQAAQQNGSPPETGEGCPKVDTPSVEERLARLEQRVAKLAAGVAAVLAQQMQPQMQKTIMEQLLK